MKQCDLKSLAIESVAKISSKENNFNEHQTDQVTVNESHSALWKKKNGLDKRENKTRNFS